MGKHRESWKRWNRELEKKPREPGGCCLFQMIFVLALTALAYYLYHSVWPDLRHKLLDNIDLAFTRDAPVEVSDPIAYGNHEDRKLIVYRGKDAPANGPRPVLMFFHGGGWANGDPADYGFIGRNFAPKGFVVVNVGYRLLPEGEYPAMLVDSAAALRWTVQNIARYGGDPERIYLMGHSAGAYNAVMLGLDRRWTRRQGLPEDAIDGVIGLAGPYDFLPLDSENTRQAFGEVRPLARSQPINFARADAPPMLLATGRQDEEVEPADAEALFRALEAKGAAARLEMFDRMGHAGILMALAEPFDHDSRVEDAVTAFLRERLREDARARTEAERRARETTEGEPEQASGDIQPAEG